MKQCKCGNVLFFRTPALNCLKCGLPVPYYKNAVKYTKVTIDIKSLRLLTGLSQTELAKKLHVTAKRFRDLEAKNAALVCFAK